MNTWWHTVYKNSDNNCNNSNTSIKLEKFYSFKLYPQTNMYFFVFTNNVIAIPFVSRSHAQRRGGENLKTSVSLRKSRYMDLWKSGFRLLNQRKMSFCKMEWKSAAIHLNSCSRTDRSAAQRWNISLPNRPTNPRFTYTTSFFRDHVGRSHRSAQNIS